MRYSYSLTCQSFWQHETVVINHCGEAVEERSPRAQRNGKYDQKQLKAVVLVIGKYDAGVIIMSRNISFHRPLLFVFRQPIYSYFSRLHRYSYAADVQSGVQPLTYRCRACSQVHKWNRSRPGHWFCHFILVMASEEFVQQQMEGRATVSSFQLLNHEQNFNADQYVSVVLLTN